MDAKTGSPTPTMDVDRRVVQLFLIHEAQLLDERRFRDWMALFTEDGTYWVPAVPDRRARSTRPHCFMTTAS